jgi:hypothetical protein
LEEVGRIRFGSRLERRKPELLATARVFQWFSAFNLRQPHSPMLKKQIERQHRTLAQLPG